MTEFHVRSDAVDVEQIMRQIRARIREKRGVDYTEDEIRRLATVKLEKFLEPGSVRSDLLEQFRRREPPPPPTPPPPLPNYAFEADTIYTSHRVLVRAIRAVLRPVLKLFFNPGPLIQVLHLQGKINAQVAGELQQLREDLWTRDRKREEVGALYFEVLHNLVVELTKLGIEVRNLKMRVESLASRLDFDERRARALEGAVAYRPEVAAEAPAAEGPEAQRRRKRRRRRRRTAAAGEAGAAPAEASTAASAAAGEASAATSRAAEGGADQGGAERGAAPAPGAAPPEGEGRAVAPAEPRRAPESAEGPATDAGPGSRTPDGRVP